MWQTRARLPITHQGVGPRTLALHFGEVLKRIRVCHVNLSVPGLHGARLPKYPQRSCDRLPIRPYHARQLLVGVAGGYPVVVACRSTFTLAESKDQARQPGRNLLADQVR